MAKKVSNKRLRQMLKDLDRHLSGAPTKEAPKEKAA